MKKKYTTEQILECLRDLDWTEEVNDSGWEGLNRLIRFMEGEDGENNF